MKKFLLMNTLISACFLSACSSSPPEPPQINEDAPAIYLNNQVYRQTPTATVAKNTGDHNGKPWVYQYVNLDTNDYVNETEKSAFSISLIMRIVLKSTVSRRVPKPINTGYRQMG
ncbi:lipoprotein [Aggregatibacter actinomycetemcomitans]|uniref:Lipoprotein n=1 Tax=Aggregatibacter actinomycetemcomitans TaxID=714 RepID=S4W5Y5_AGGAC|nr:lipoprotein [Aggregatibacter actinomycetemcomitans]AGO88764.1 lipoprotein [Aggregatibacter actinomycetemcomitans]